MRIVKLIVLMAILITVQAHESVHLDTFEEEQETKPRTNIRSNKRLQKNKEKTCRSYVYPLTWNQANIFMEVDYIYWKPIARIPYAVTMNIVGIRNDFADTYRLSINRTIERVNLEGTSGFKVELGAYIPPYGWLSSAEYTYLSKTGSGTASGEERSEVTDQNAIRDLNAIWRTELLGDNNGNPERLTNASADQKLSYQVFDWILQKSVFWKDKFGFSPYFGIRGAWIKNRLNVTYNGIRTHDSNGPLLIQDIARIDSDYRGGGLRIGFKGNWLLGYGLEIFGNTSMSLVYGQHDIRQKEDFQRRIGSNPNENNLLRGSTTSGNDWTAIRSAFQLVLGMDWGRNFNQDKVFFGLKLAYEINLWPEVIQLRRLMRDARVSGIDQLPNLGSNTTNDPLQDFNRSLGLHGMTLGARVDF